jgi:hypothetical protein
MILRETSNIINPTLQKWDLLKFQNNITKSRMNIEIAKKSILVNYNDSIDEMILNALIAYDNLNSFVIFGKNKTNAYHLYNDIFKEEYILYGIKSFQLNKEDAIKMIYQFIFPRIIIKSKNHLMEYINEKYPFISNFTGEIIDISTLILFKRKLDIEYPIKDISIEEYLIYIPKKKEEKNICASVIFCQNSIDFIKLQNFDYYFSKEKSKKMFLKYKKWLHNNIPYEKQCSFMLFSSVVLFLIGNREMNDLDLYIHYIDEEIKEKVIEIDDISIVNERSESFNYIEYQIKGDDTKWPLYWNKWLDEWARKSGAKYFEEVLASHKFHFYYLGVKIISLNCDIQRRVIRNRSNSTADLIALRKRYKISDFPKIPKPSQYETVFLSVKDNTEEGVREIIKYCKEYNNENKEVNLIIPTNINVFLEDFKKKYNHFTIKEIIELIKKCEYKQENKEIVLTLPNDINIFLFKIQKALEKRYKMIFTINELKRELDMPI